MSIAAGNHRSYVRPLLIGVAAGSIAVSGGAAVALTQATTAPTDRVTTTMALPGDIVPNLSAYRDLGPTPSGEQVIVDLTLNRPDVAGEKALWNAMYTPGNPDYHHFLTPAQFDARFGVATHTYNAVRDWGTRDGLSVLGERGSGDIIRLSGTAQQMERTFGVAFHDFVTKDGYRFYANTSAPTVPAGHAVQGLIGLNSLNRSHTYQTGPVAMHRRSHAMPAQTQCTLGTCIGLTTPQDLWSTYDMPGGSSADPRGNLSVDFGQGQQMAIFGEGMTDPVISNLRTFESLHNLPRVPVTVVRTDGTKAKYTDNAGEVEWDLDTQSSTGMSPDVRREVLYFGKDLSDASVLGVFKTWTDDPNGPLQANASYGECEENPAGDTEGKVTAPYSAGAMFTVKAEDTLRKATMEGRTLFSSTGDTGGTCPLLPVSVNGVGYEVPGVNYPAVSPYVVGVGGTVLYTNGAKAPQRKVEYGWTYGGGGTSLNFVKPKYQDGISAITGVCAFAPGGGTANAGKPCRGIPDIAAQSGDVASNGYGIVAEGETAYPGGGTSLASPLSMGMWTRIQAAAPGVSKCGKAATYPGLGFANPVLYKQFKSSHGKRDFADIGSGAPTFPPSDNAPYPSTPGWDYQSGMGVMDVNHLIQDITGSHSLRPAHAVLPKQPTTNVGGTKRPNACTPLFTDPSGDDAFVGDPNGSGSNPQLDIVAGNINTVGSSLQTVMVIADLSTKMANAAGGGNEYYFVWTYKGTQYFTDAEVDSAGNVTYHDGTISGTTYSNAHNDTGQFVTGKDGRVVVDVPLANVGKPATGATLKAPAAQTRVLVGTAQTGGLIEQADATTAHYDYTVGDRCTNAAGIAPPPYSTSTSTGAPLRYGSSGSLPPIAASGKDRIVVTCSKSKGGQKKGSGNGSSSGNTSQSVAGDRTLAATGGTSRPAAVALALIALALGAVAWRRMGARSP